MARKKRTTRARHAAGLFDELIVDNFAGGGGASIGIERAMGRAVDVAINHDREAVALHQANHPHTLHHCEDVWDVDPVEATSGRPVGLAWFSPDCKHFSRAKGGKPVEKKIRGLAWVVVKWAAKVRPRVIMLENVREFETWGPVVPLVKDGAKVVDRDGNQRFVPCPARKGATFRRWVRCLQSLGYEVAWRTLDAADFGAPTHRKRLFLVARNDGQPIRWPEPTHGPGRLPYRTAAECIDWSLPCPSIFLTREEGRKLGVNRPLAEKTMRRIAMGLKRFVLDNPDPFIVRTGPGLASPYLTAQNGERSGQRPRATPADAPINVVTPRVGGGHPLVVPHLVRTGQYGGNGSYSNGVGDPLTTITSKAEHCLVTPHLTKFFGGVVGQEATRPAPTITSVDHTGVVAATLLQYNQEKGSEVRGKGLGRPVNTIPTANRFGLVAAFLTRFYGRSDTRPVDVPAPTFSAEIHDGLVAANLIKMNHGDKQAFAADEPLRTVLAGANHHGITRAFLMKYYGGGPDGANGVQGQGADRPFHTVRANDCFGLVSVRGEDYRIADIGLRMLRPRELYRAQGFPEDYRIDLTVDGRKLPSSAQVRMCGNSVSPPVAEALVLANFAAEIAPARKEAVFA